MALGPAEIGAQLSDWMIRFGGGQFLKWGGYILISSMCICALYVLFYITQFKIKEMVFPLYGSGKDGVFAIDKTKRNRCRWINKKTAWQRMLPIATKRQDEPYDSEYIYPGNQIYSYDLNGVCIPGRVNVSIEYKDISEVDKRDLELECIQYIRALYPDNKIYKGPMKININKSEAQIRAEINPVPYSWRAWQSLQHKKNAQEFAEDNWWQENKYFMSLVITCLVCATMIIATAYFTMKYTGTKAIPALERWTAAINNANVIPGK